MDTQQHISLRKLAKQILKHHGLSPKKFLSQNFLTDRKIYEKIIAAGELTAHDQVIEIGPGLGFLTSVLAQSAGSVVAIEIDDDMAMILESLVPVTDNLTVVHQDILATDIDTIAGIDTRKPYKVIANIPYHITAKIIRKFLTAQHKPTHIVLLVQYEVAERIIASAGEHSLLSLSVQYYGKPEIIARVSRRAFYPEPQVASAILKITITNHDMLEEEMFWKIARLGFSSKRKKLLNNLSHGLMLEKPVLIDLFDDIGIDTGSRAQHVSLVQWQKLVQAISICLDAK